MPDFLEIAVRRYTLVDCIQILLPVFTDSTTCVFEPGGASVSCDYFWKIGRQAVGANGRQSGDDYPPDLIIRAKN